MLCRVQERLVPLCPVPVLLLPLDALELALLHLLLRLHHQAQLLRDLLVVGAGLGRGVDLGGMAGKEMEDNNTTLGEGHIRYAVPSKFLDHIQVVLYAIKKRSSQ